MGWVGAVRLEARWDGRGAHQGWEGLLKVGGNGRLMEARRRGHGVESLLSHMHNDIVDECHSSAKHVGEESDVFASSKAALASHCTGVWQAIAAPWHRAH